MKLCLWFILGCAMLSQQLFAASTSFEDLTLQTLYTVGTTFTSQDLAFKVVPFTSGNATVRVSQNGYAGSSGKEIFMLSRAGLEFQLAAVVNDISFRYGEYCCHSGVTINGVTTTPANGLVGLNGMTIAGGTFAVVSTGAGNDQGFLRVTGDIESFIVGGTEFAIDDAVVLGDVQSGDFDFDGDVDGRDFLIWQRGNSLNPLSAVDLATWQAEYGPNEEFIAAGAAVPEPLTFNLFGIAVFTLIARRRLTLVD